MKGVRFGIFFALSLLAGCEFYSPLPLEEHPRLATSLAALKTEGPEGKVDVSHPLTVGDVVRLALLNNPDLVAARADDHISEAQLLQAGLLPNPQATFDYGWLRAGPGTSNQWTAALSEDIRTLITYSANLKSAKFATEQDNADLLWQEWQVVGKARLAFVDRVKGLEALGLLEDARVLLADRYERERHAVERHDLALSEVSPDLAALADMDKQIADAELKSESQRRGFNALLGLDPAVPLALAPDMDVPEIDPKLIDRAVADLPNRRPDLVALKLGYGSQEEKVWAAILGQFPAFVFGGSGGHDTSKIYTVGPTVTMDLPIFNRNQGNIAIEKATREKLRAEYTNRVAADVAEIQGMMTDQALLMQQLARTKAAAAAADRTAQGARSAYATTLIDARTDADLVTAALTRKQEVVAIEQTLLEQQVALATLTGISMPAIAPPPDSEGWTHQ